jgi:hypothetical protein
MRSGGEVSMKSVEERSNSCGEEENKEKSMKSSGD